MSSMSYCKVAIGLKKYTLHSTAITRFILLLKMLTLTMNALKSMRYFLATQTSWSSHQICGTLPRWVTVLYLWGKIVCKERKTKESNVIFITHSVVLFPLLVISVVLHPLHVRFLFFSFHSCFRSFQDVKGPSLRRLSWGRRERLATNVSFLSLNR